MGLAVILVLGCLAAYSALFSAGLARAGAVDSLPAVSVLVCSLIMLILTFLKSSGALVGLRDYDMVMSLPVKSSEVVLSRLTMTYLTNFFVSAIVVLPAAVIFAWNADAGMASNAIFLFSLLFIPVIPTVISLGLGVLITAVSSHSRHKNIFSLLLSILAVLLIVAATTQAQQMNSSELLNIGLALSNIAEQVYPPAVLVSIAVSQQNWLYFFAFAGISVFVGGIFIWVVAHFYQAMNTAAFGNAGAKYSGSTPKVSSPAKAMYKREFSRYFSCTIYALNSTIGMVLLCAVSVLATIGIGMLSSVAPLFICIFFLDFSGPVMGLTSVLLLIITFVLYGKLRDQQLYAV